MYFIKPLRRYAERKRDKTANSLRKNKKKNDSKTYVTRTVIENDFNLHGYTLYPWPME